MSGVALRWRIPALGIAQIIAWGSLYYAIAVLAAPLQADLGFSRTFLFGGFTLALLVSGAVAPLAGRLIDRDGGRRVLVLATVAGAASFALLACSHGPVLYLLAWTLGGVAMGCGLYDAVLAVLNHLAPGAAYRRAVTALTLFGGFASTVFWPLTHWLVEAVGWRDTCWYYAAAQLLLCLPLYLFAAPAHGGVVGRQPGSAISRAAPDPARFRWLAMAFALVSFAFSVLSVHLIGLLGESGIAERDAILVGTVFGPMQVLARIVEFSVAPHVRAVAVGRVAFLLMACALAALCVVDGRREVAFLFAALYGASNGTLTIVRGTVPAELFGREQYGALLGKLALPSFLAKAIAPMAFAAVLSAGSHVAAMALLLVAGAGALVCYEFARRGA